MKLTHLAISNVLGIRSADIALDTPVTLFAAGNKNGKTSLAEAVRMALTGDITARGIAQKKDLQALVHDGAKSGSCEVAVDGKTAFILLPSGKSTPLTEWVAPAALPYVLDAQRFASLDGNMRRSFLFGLMGLHITPNVVLERLTKRGVDVEKAKLVVPYLRAGFTEACKEAKTKATEAKGAWRALTGETYGSVKAASWAADKPEVDAGAVDKTIEKIETLDNEIADANQQLGRLQGALAAHQQRQGKVAALEAKIEGKERATVKLAKDEGELADWETKVTGAQGEHSPAGMPCPCCKALLTMVAGALVEAKPVTINPEAEHLVKYTQARDLMKRSVEADKKALAEITAAEAELKAITADESEVPKASDVEEAQIALHQLKERRTTNASLLEKLKADQRAAAAADAATTKAGEHHATVVAWDLIADALAPDGIPGDMLNEALEPFNKRLEQAALDCEWPAPFINPDMSIVLAAETNTAGRPYQLLSESEKWRVDAMLAEAISFLSGVKLMVLDRFDVLDLAGRADLLAWLDVLASTGDVDTVLLFGTLKQPPAHLPATATAVWIEAGVAQLAQQLQAA
jgi:hypothetical protein